MWKKAIILDKPIRRYSVFGNVNGDGAVAYCNSDEMVIGGGGVCASGTTNFVHASYPVSAGDVVFASGSYSIAADGWFANCFNVPGYAETAAQAFAICLKKS